MGPEFTTLQSPQRSQQQVDEMRAAKREEFVGLLQNGVGQVLELTSKMSGSISASDHAIKGNIKEVIVNSGEVAVVLTNVQQGRHVGSPETGDTVYSPVQAADKIVRIGDYTFQTLAGRHDCIGFLFNL